MIKGVEGEADGGVGRDRGENTGIGVPMGVLMRVWWRCTAALIRSLWLSVVNSFK